MRNRFSPETNFYIVIWVILLLIPAFAELYDYLVDITDHFDWRGLCFVYVRFLPYLLLFLLCKLVLEPKLFFKQKQPAFFIISFIAAVVLLLVSGYFIPPRSHRSWIFVEQKSDTHLPRQSTDIQFIDGEPVGNREIVQNLNFKSYLRGPFFPRLLMALLMNGSSLACAALFRSSKDKLMLKEQQAAQLQSELTHLKYQINPHFFMNTLNNIHALVDIDSELAKQTIIELSHLMRYILYESDHPTVPLRRELDFIRQCINLIRLRCDESVSLTFTEPETNTPGLDAYIPPLLLVPFIGNAFKHGISYREPSYIDVNIAIEGRKLHFHCANSNHSSNTMPKQQGGIGLDNVRKRLEFIYPGRYTLDIVPTEKDFTVDLVLPLTSNPQNSQTPSNP